ncbi:MAG: hypothetical protein IT578_00335 [Verrucomicrobiae bacterium]|nr:hypothetical protein [Verrucomicrobiae bacterium]
MMAGSSSSARAPSRFARWYGSLLLLLAATAVVWPAFRDAGFAGSAAAAAPFLRRIGIGKAAVPRASTQLLGDPAPSDRLAALARRMEFRLRHYRVTPQLLRDWCAEWNCSSSEKLQLLRLMLGQLPEAAAKETPASQRQDVLQGVLDLSAELRRADPGNGFPWLAEALALLHSGQDAPAKLALDEALRAAHADAGLRAVNVSELAVWAARLDPWVLFPPMPRRWGLQAERPLLNLGRSLSLQQRAFLKKYNLERANDLAMTQLRLAVFLAECGWTPGDLAAARAAANRAMLPLWPSPTVAFSDELLERHFLSTLEDQGDRVNLAKARAWLADLGRREDALRRNLPTWRAMQRLSAWTAPSVLAALLAQAVLALGGWLLLAATTRPATGPVRARWAMGVLAFAPAPIVWSMLGWPPGASLLVVGLVGAFTLWAWWASATPGGFRAARAKLAVAALGTLAAFFTLILLAAAAVQYQRAVLPPLLRDGLIAPR